jgi:hypothetical protein
MFSKFTTFSKYFQNSPLFRNVFKIHHFFEKKSKFTTKQRKTHLTFPTAVPLFRAPGAQEAGQSGPTILAHQIISQSIFTLHLQIVLPFVDY